MHPHCMVVGAVTCSVVCVVLTYVCMSPVQSAPQDVNFNPAIDTVNSESAYLHVHIIHTYIYKYSSIQYST